MFRQIVGIPMGTTCAPVVADLFLFWHERDFVLSLSDNNQADVVWAFNSTSRYLDNLLIIDNPYFAQMVSQIYPTVHSSFAIILKRKRKLVALMHCLTDVL